MEDFEEAEPEPEVLEQGEEEVEVEVEQSTGEQVEQDTQEAEDVLDLAHILLPDSSLPQGADQFGVLYNKKLLDGWVKQPSACCGAAAVAGALNCLGAMSRKHMSSLNHVDILNVYRTIMSNAIAKKKASFERCLGGPVGVFLARLEEDVFSNNLEQSRKRYATSKKEVLNSVRKLVAANREVKEGVPSEVSPDESEMSVTCALLDELLALERQEEQESDQQGEGDSTTMLSTPNDSPRTESCEQEKTKENSTEVEDVEKGDGNGNEKEVEEEDEELITNHASASAVITVIPGKKPWSVKARPKKKKGAKSSKSSSSTHGKKSNGEDDTATRLVHNTWEWKTSLCEIVKKVAGLRKLEADKPSTACIGNWGILAGLNQLVELTDIGSSCVSARLFMGKGIAGPRSKVQVPLSHKDGPSQITTQWNALRSVFADPNEVLLFHLKNHYALIFAVREWTVREEVMQDKSGEMDESCDSVDRNCEDEGNRRSSVRKEVVRTVREMYTARRGQRPAVWINFDEARQTMLGWEGYKIMALSRQDPAVGDDKESSVAQLRQVKGLLEQHFPAQAWGGNLRHSH
jgi:hypothetical protein